MEQEEEEEQGEQEEQEEEAFRLEGPLSTDWNTTSGGGGYATINRLEKAGVA